jgi:hypothetical protein
MKFEKETNNANAFELVSAIDLLIKANQWNEIMRYMACTTPKEFIKFVEDFREDGGVESMLKPERVIVRFEGWDNDSNLNMKIPVIKALREAFQLGLADAKYLSETIPCDVAAYDRESDILKYVISKLDVFGIKICLIPDSKTIPCKFPNVNTTLPLGWVAPTHIKMPPIKCYTRI